MGESFFGQNKNALQDGLGETERKKDGKRQKERNRFKMRTLNGDKRIKYKVRRSRGINACVV